MPKLYEYMGIFVMFYTNEHEPIHVHGKCQGREAKAELILENGQVTHINYKGMKGKPPLKATELKNFQELVEQRAAEIVQTWIDFFVLGRPVQIQKITRRLK